MSLFALLIAQQAEQRHGVDSGSGQAHGPMQMRARYQARGADFPHQLTGVDRIPFPDIKCRHMSEIGIESQAMIDDHGIARVI
jgi:hypothetical protein